ncbi:MAG: hypothetical protein ABSF70_01000 [Terracidiphilus sp.]
MGGSEVDVEANFIVLDAKADYSAGTQKIVSFSHGENWQVSQGGQRKVPAILFVNEEHVAFAGGLGEMDMSNVNGPRPDLLSLDGVFQFVEKSIVFESAQKERVAAMVEGVGGPLHKLREMKQESGLDAIGIVRWLRPGVSRCERMEYHRAEK